MNFDQLNDPFPVEQIRWRIQESRVKDMKPWALILAYVDARAVMSRLDRVFGQIRWRDQYKHLEDGVLCTIGYWDGNQWIEKQDGAPETKFEAFKGGISKAFVRCAVKWGIGRYLYNLPQQFAECSLEKKNGYQYAKTKDGKVFYWRVPQSAISALRALEGDKQETRGGLLESTMEIPDQVKYIKELSSYIVKDFTAPTHEALKLKKQVWRKEKMHVDNWDQLFDKNSQTLDEIIEYLEKELDAKRGVKESER